MDTSSAKHRIHGLVVAFETEGVRYRLVGNDAFIHVQSLIEGITVSACVLDALA